MIVRRQPYHCRRAVSPFLLLTHLHLPNSSSSSVIDTRQHLVTISGLDSRTIYFYQCRYILKALKVRILKRTFFLFIDDWDLGNISIGVKIIVILNVMLRVAIVVRLLLVCEIILRGNSKS